MAAPRASVIIDNFNYAQFLGPAIESALGQSYPDTEVVVVDDGSSDASREVIASYGERIVPVLKANGGQGSAINAGFAASSGDVVLVADADDLLLPGAIEAVVPHFEDPEVAKVHWSMPVIDAAGRPTGEVEEPVLAGGDLRPDVLREGPGGDATLPSAPTSGNAWSRRFLERVMPMPEDIYRRSADTYLFTLAPAYGKIVVLDHPQSLYRLHGDNGHACSFAERLGREQPGLEVLARIAARPFQEAGIAIDLDRWVRGSWWGRVIQATEEITELVGEGETFLLADEDMWGTDEDFFGRRRVLFPDLNGEWGGVPEGDAAAITEVERGRERGAVAIVFGWPAHWWLDHFRALAGHLDEGYRCLRRDELIVAYGLRA